MSPNVVAVGGTTLSVDSAGDYLGESGWSGSGGGISTEQSQPAYQKGLVTQSSTARTIPDVAFDADPNSGVSIYDTYDFGSSAPWITVGGTSVASPCFAGIIAVVDQGRSLVGGASLDGATKTLPQLYALPAAAYHDISTGNNGYAAGPGYDLVTGIGSPVANVLIPKLTGISPINSFQLSAHPDNGDLRTSVHPHHYRTRRQRKPCLQLRRLGDHQRSDLFEFVGADHTHERYIC